MIGAIKLFIILSVSFLSTNILAEPAKYDIEILIFENTSNAYINSEQWPVSGPAITEASGVKDSNPEKVNKNPENIKNISKILLNRYNKIINKSNEYNLLIHKAWRQEGLDADTAFDIEINNTNNNASTDSTQNLPSIINGSIKVVLGRYLHLYTDLIYERSQALMPYEIQSDLSNGVAKFKIKAHRKMRSKELHYIDHPLVGILIMAMPVEIEKETEEKPTDEVTSAHDMPADLVTLYQNSRN